MVVHASFPRSAEPVNTSTVDGDIARLFHAQREHWPGIRNTTAQERKAKLQRLLDRVMARREDILDALAADYRKPRAEADVAEVAGLALEIKFAMRNLKRWMQPRWVKTPLLLLGTTSEIRYESKGIGLIISPWNYPFLLTLGPLVGAIAAGCCMMIKPSEYTPHSSRLMKELLADVFDEREVAVIEGDHTAAQALLKLPFNHIYYTGSAEIGKIVMKAAAEHLASVTLELGGKSPTIVDETVDLDEAAEKITFGKFSNCGQICMAPDYVLVQERVHDDFVQAVNRRIAASYGKTETERTTTPNYGRIVNERHQQRLQALYESAVGAGAKVAVGGSSIAEDRYIAPTVLTDVPRDTPLMHEEIFGPLLPILKYERLDDAVALVNSKPNPLVLYMFSKSDANVERVLSQTTAGATCINETLFHFLHPELPFGGAGYSGIGKAYHQSGFLAFSNERPVLRRTWQLPAIKLLYPPYTSMTRRLVSLVLRFL